MNSWEEAIKDIERFIAAQKDICSERLGDKDNFFAKKNPMQNAKHQGEKRILDLLSRHIEYIKKQVLINLQFKD